MNEEEDINILLVKYITGQANNEETIIVKNWFNAHPENEQYFAQLYEAWQNSLLSSPDQLVNTGKAFKLFVSKTSLQGHDIKRYKRWIITAVSVAALIFAFIGLFTSTNHHTVPLNQLAAVPGKTSKITLTDGTVVWLNSGSVLQYGNDFGKTTRTVYLEGEGFFDIAKGKKQIPFLVHTKNYIIRDIGTRFNLKAYPNDPFFETAVVNGEVSIEDKGQKDNATNRIYVKQRQSLRIYNREMENGSGITGVNNNFEKSYNDIKITQFTPDKEDSYIGWKDNLLVFDSSTMDDIARVLERRYDVKINIADTTLQHIRYSGNFKNVKSIDSVLDIIKQNTPITYSTSGAGLITITKDEN
ncbi:MAG: FecR family protein [Sphingobacteriaceae bacterium]